MNEQIPEGSELLTKGVEWQEVKLGDICDIRKGSTTTKKEAGVGTIPVIAGGIEPSYYHDKSNRQPPIITVSGSGVNAGFVNFFDEPIYASDCSTIESKNIQKTNIKFLYYFLQSIQRNIYILQRGATIPHVHAKDLQKILFSLPPLHEQKKIAAILTSIDEVIEKAGLQINKLKDLKKATMNELLTKGIGHTEFQNSSLGKIPKSWKVFSLGEISKVRRGASPRPIRDSRWWGGNIGWTRISDVTSATKYLNKTKNYLSDEGAEHSVRIPIGEVILSICATIGRPIIVNTDVCIHDGFVWFDKLSLDINREYFYYFLSSKEEQLSSSRQTGTQGNLNTDIVSRLPIPLPSLIEQQKIGAILASIDNQIEEKQRKLQQTHSLKKAIMGDLLEGKQRYNIPSIEVK